MEGPLLGWIRSGIILNLDPDRLRVHYIRCKKVEHISTFGYIDNEDDRLKLEFMRNSHLRRNEAESS
jgi:hypothetical protein